MGGVLALRQRQALVVGEGSEGAAHAAGGLHHGKLLAAGRGIGRGYGAFCCLFARRGKGLLEHWLSKTRPVREPAPNAPSTRPWAVAAASLLKERGILPGKTTLAFLGPKRQRQGSIYGPLQAEPEMTAIAA